MLRVRHLTIASAALLLGGQPLRAQTVATIYGVYDNSGFGSLPGSVTGNPASGGRYSNGGTTYDTPSLFFVNSSTYNIMFAKMVLHVNTLANSGQNTLNNGRTQTVDLGTISSSAITQINWNGSFSSGNLFSYDYDDEYQGWYGAGLAGNAGSFASNCTLNAPGMHPEWTQFCAPVGNFTVAFTGQLSGTGSHDGELVSAFFAEYDVDGHYTGWQGLDAMGWSENADVDVHAGTVSGVLANIQLGDLDKIVPSPITSTPEPATNALLATGLIGIVGVARRRGHRG